ncbi:hypothetical protein L343_3480 [Escherichia coli CE549]|nr:hypothetical protein L343_3480 [Escherichia coli CE549]
MRRWRVLSGLQIRAVGRIRRSRCIRHPEPDATLARLIRPTNPSRRPDKAFTLHPAPGA